MPIFGGSEVLGLDVAVGEALRLEPVDRCQQVSSEPLQQLQVEPPLRTEAVGERGVSRPRHEQAHAVGEPQHVVQLDNELMPQGTQHLRLRLEAVVALCRQRHLEHLLPSISLDEERQRRGSLPEPPLDNESMLDLVARTRIERVGQKFLRPGDFLLEAFELVEELVDRLEARGHLRVRCVLHEKLQVLAGAVQD